MTFGTAIQTVFRKYAMFEGRAGRAEFWWWILFIALVSAALAILTRMFTPIGASPYVGRASQPGADLSGLWALAVLLPTLAVTVRRLRDAGYGWPHVFWVLVPVAGLVVLAVLASQPTVPPPAPVAQEDRETASPG